MEASESFAPFLVRQLSLHFVERRSITAASGVSFPFTVATWSSVVRSFIRLSAEFRMTSGPE
jgi:hypothetical protein